MRMRAAVVPLVGALAARAQTLAIPSPLPNGWSSKGCITYARPRTHPPPLTPAQ